MSSNIGIGILTTPNRTILDNTLPEWYKYLPPDAGLIVENDRQFTGVAATSNRLLAQLDNFEHLFIVNDDVKPLVEGWYIPYTSSPEPHLMLQFSLPSKPYGDMQEIFRDDKLVSYTHTRGAFIYFHRSVLDIVGGFDEAYSFGYEHADLTNRIYNAGLTTHRAADVVGSEKLLYCYDQDSKVRSSVPDNFRRRNLVKHRELYQRSKTSREYKRYK